MNFSAIYSILNSNLSEAFYKSIDSSPIIDGIYLFGFTTIGIIGLILNTTSILVFTRIKKFHPHLYGYLMANTLVGAFESFLFLTQFIGYSPWYMEFVAVSFFSRVYRCKIVIYLGICFCLMANILDIFVLVQRLCDFDSKFKRIMCLPLKVNFLLTAIASAIISLPFYFYYNVTPDSVFLESIVNLTTTVENHTLSEMCQRDQFLSSSNGIAVTIITLIFKDVIVLVLEIYGSILIIFYFKKFINLKENIINKQDIAGETLMSNDNWPVNSLYSDALEHFRNDFTLFFQI